MVRTPLISELRMQRRVDLCVSKGSLVYTEFQASQALVVRVCSLVCLRSVPMRAGAFKDLGGTRGISLPGTGV